MAKYLLTGAVLVAALWTAILLDMSHRGRHERADGQRALQTIARLGALELKATLDLIDYILVDLRAEWLEGPSQFSLRVKQHQVRTGPDMDFEISLVGLDSCQRYSSDPLDSGRRCARDAIGSLGTSADRLTVSTPVWDEIRSHWHIQLARPVFRADGALLGKLLFTVTPEHLLRTFGSVSQRDGSALSLVREDDAVVLRFIDPPDGSSIPPLNPAGAAALPTAARPFVPPPGLVQGPASGVGERRGAGGAVERIYAWQNLGSYPLALIVSQPVDLIFKDIAVNRTRYLAGGLIASCVLMLACYGLAVAARTRARSRAKLERNLQMLRQGQAELLASREALRELAEHQATVREDERKHIAGELHDELGQRLTMLRMDIALLPRLATRQGTGAVDQETRRLLESIDALMAQVRGIARRLRPSALDIGLVSAVEAVVEEFAASLSIPISLDNQLPPHLDIDERLATTVFRLLQESLTNAARHSGASAIRVGLALSNGSLELTVQDDGAGFDPGSPALRHSFGLPGMKARAGALGGSLVLVTTPGAGTLVRALIPLQAPTAPVQADSRLATA